MSNCPRVQARIFCDECGYPKSEALYTNDADQIGVPHAPTPSPAWEQEDIRNAFTEVLVELSQHDQQPWVKPTARRLLAAVRASDALHAAARRRIEALEKEKTLQDAALACYAEEQVKNRAEVAALSAQVEQMKAYSQQLDEALIEMEKAGWPCRLVEAPAMIRELGTQVGKLSDDLALERARTEEADRFAEKLWAQRDDLLAQVAHLTQEKDTAVRSRDHYDDERRTAYQAMRGWQGRAELAESELAALRQSRAEQEYAARAVVCSKCGVEIRSGFCGLHCDGRADGCPAEQGEEQQ